MSQDEAIALMDEALGRLMEHFDCCQIHASWMVDESQTQAVHHGAGNFYARESMAREFCERNKVQELAEAIGRVMDEEDEDDGWKEEA